MSEIRFDPQDLEQSGRRQRAGAVNMLVDNTGRHRAEQRSGTSESRYRRLFENVRVAIWEEDFSDVAELLDDIRGEGVADLRAHLLDRPDRLSEALRRVRVKNVNAFAVELFEADRKETLIRSLAGVFVPETAATFIEELMTIWEGRRRFEGEAVMQTLNGRLLDVAFTMAFEGARCEHTLVSLLDISGQKSAERALREQTHRLETLNKVARAISSDLDLQRIVQTVTDAATDVSGARFGAFFFNKIDGQGECHAPYAVSGAPRAAFDSFALPRNAALFDPIFRGGAVIRSDDVRSDPRYGESAADFDVAAFVSYMAVPVVSRSGEILGALFLGHDRPGMFSAASEEIVTAIAAHAAIAIDNARLLQAKEAEVDHRRHADRAAQQLAAIVESSDDAILTKDLNGIITSWNQGAERLFGYTAEDVIGKPINILIPRDRQDEETAILARIRAGQRTDHYETVRRRNDGSQVEISLTVSPVKDAEGRIVGASKIARDITERRRAEEQQILLIREMAHRAKNLFALCGSVVSLSARSAGSSATELAATVTERLAALARSTELTLPRTSETATTGERPTTLHALIATILSPYDGRTDAGGPRVVLSGPDIRIAGRCVTSFALLLHEFATNATKYGALSTTAGHVEIRCADAGERFALTWREVGGPPVHQTGEEGFGTFLSRATVKGQLGGDISWDWKPDGLTIHLAVSRDHLGR